MSDRSPGKAYSQWLDEVNKALIAEGRPSLFSLSKEPLPRARDGSIPDEPGDPMAADVDAICKKHGIPPFKFYREPPASPRAED